MKEGELWASMDALTEAWSDLEKVVAGLTMGETDLELTVQRSKAGAVRLCYRGRPLAECKVGEKIEAAQLLPQFYVAYTATRASLATEARKAAELVAACTRRLRELEDPTPVEA